ncbi:hypothetical protein [Cellulomonas sp.]|uniref:hypothetical protein n=1 Tax=Cellulomonas sp. TaxID=40001 RepID=UPI001B0CB776|nr:hypothetical protein [Cellulomonas sp.]MBO9554710.1 hypothetical protein [Cellulomonas sp.]
MAAALAAAGEVPDLRVPSTAGPTGPVVLLGLVGIVGVVFFVLVVLGAGRLAAAGRNPLAWFGVALAVMVVPIGTAALIDHHNKSEADRQWDAYWPALDRAEDGVAQLLLDRYGVTFDEPGRIPMDEGISTWLRLTRADGTRSHCLVGTFDDTYAVRCGDPAWDAAHAMCTEDVRGDEYFARCVDGTWDEASELERLR